MQFYVADYLRDTEILTLEAQGGYMRILCSMWHPARRGVLTLRLEAVARLLSISAPATRNILEEISQCNVAAVVWGGHGEAIASDDNPTVTITSRRMVRDWEEMHRKAETMSEGGKKGAAKRWGNREADSPPIPPPTAPGYDNPEVRSQKSEGGKEEKFSPPPDLDEEVRKKLRAVWRSAPQSIVGRELTDYGQAWPTLIELTADDWQACQAWVSASNRIRGRKLWPRDRAEFLGNIGQAIEAIRRWWKAGGRDWWTVKTAAGIAPQTGAKPAVKPFVPLSPEKQAEAKALLSLRS